MKRSLLMFAVLALSNQAFAGLTCSIEGYEDYTVEVNQKGDKAAFFDNNDWSVVKSTAVLGFFSGVDYQGSPLKIKVDYTEGLVQHHSITFDDGGKAVTSSMDCSYTADQDLNSGI